VQKIVNDTKELEQGFSKMGYSGIYDIEL